MNDDAFCPEFSTASALECARAGHLERWIDRYLGTGPWANPGLREGLKKQRRWWRGPLELPLAQLRRSCGPEPEMEYRMPQAAWDARVARIAAHLDEPLAVAPLIVEYRAGELSIRDGNHRYGAMQRAGWPACWVVIWHNSQADFEAATSVSDTK